MQRKVYEDANHGTLVTEVPATCLNDSHDVLGHVKRCLHHWDDGKSIGVEEERKA